MNESLRISSSTFTQCAAKATEFGEITHNKGHCTVQGHLRSPILVPIESSYDFLLVINTNLPSILHRFRDIAFGGSKIAIFYYPLVFNSHCGGVTLGRSPWNFPWMSTDGQGTDAIEMLSKIWTARVGCTSVTGDRQTDAPATANSEREREFTFANKTLKFFKITLF